MAVMKRVSNLKCVNCVGTSFSCNLVNLCWSHTILVHAIVEFDFLSKSHWCSWNQMVSLFPYTADFGMILRVSSKSFCNNFFLSIIKNFWLLNNSQNLILILKCNRLLSFNLSLLFGSNMLSNWYWKNMSFTIFICNCVHVHTFN